MPAYVESMFSVRRVPWHGLGTIVEKAPTSKEAIELIATCKYQHFPRFCSRRNKTIFLFVKNRAKL